MAPFGDVDAIATPLARELAAGQRVRSWLMNAQGKPVLREFGSDA